MTALDTVLADVFEHRAEARLTRDEERRQIALAQNGDEDATIALIYAYAPLLRAQVTRHISRLGEEDARGAAIAGLLEAVHTFNLREHSGQLAGPARFHVTAALREADGGGTITVPKMARWRYSEILKAAEGDLGLAETIAPSMGLSVDTFRAVREALAVSHISEGEDDGRVQGQHSIDRATPVWVVDRDAISEDTRDMAQEALAAITPKHEAIMKGGHWVAAVRTRTATGDVIEELPGEYRRKGDALMAAGMEAATRRDPLDVIRHAYGFVTGEAMSDEEIRRAIARRELGEDAAEAGAATMSRAKVQRIRTAALALMRDSLEGVA